MESDYRRMWRELGLDLEAHDSLLTGLGEVYREIFLVQPERPRAMAAFDALMSEVHGRRIAELRAAQRAGRKVIGAFCVFVPEEIVIAADAILVGLCTGADFAPGLVEARLPRNTCALIKSAFGFKLARVCPYLEVADMVVGENTCDGKKKSFEILAGLVDNFYVLDLPQMKSPAGRGLLAAEYRRFLAAVEALTGVEITTARLRRGIAVVNAKRRALERLARLRAAAPAPLSGLDALLVNQVSFYDDPERFTAAVERLCDELEERVAGGISPFSAGAPRILLSGCPMAVPNWKLPRLIEVAGAVVVGEEACVGERGWRHPVAEPVPEDPANPENLGRADAASREALLDAVIERYCRIDCAIFTPNPEREIHLLEMAARCRADGIIHYSLQFCQPYAIESLALKERLAARGLKMLNIETDYGNEDLGQLETRVGAFIEMVGARSG